MLDHHGVAVSTGSACSSQEEKPSRVLKAIGLSDKSALETIRISLGHKTSSRDITYTTRLLRDYFAGRVLHVNLVTSEQLDGSLLSADDTYILDVRPQAARRRLASLPDSHEVSIVSISKYLEHLPMEKHILIVCQRGNLSFIAAYYLKSKGFEHVSSLQGGLMGWKSKRE